MGFNSGFKGLITAMTTAYAKVLAWEFVWKCEESLELEDNLFLRRVLEIVYVSTITGPG